MARAQEQVRYQPRKTDQKQFSLSWVQLFLTQSSQSQVAPALEYVRTAAQNQKAGTGNLESRKQQRQDQIIQPHQLSTLHIRQSRNQFTQSAQRGLNDVEKLIKKSKSGKNCLKA